MQLCHGYFGDTGLTLIRLSINGNNFYENSYRLGGGHGPPGPPTKSAPGLREFLSSAIANHFEMRCELKQLMVLLQNWSF